MEPGSFFSKIFIKKSETSLSRIFYGVLWGLFSQSGRVISSTAPQVTKPSGAQGNW